MAKEPIVIKKYENRRLYNSTASRYVNLDGVAELVRLGEEIQVIEAKSGEDITRQILTQIIVERSKAGQQGPPIEFLRDMVRASDRAYQDFLHSYLRGAAEVYDRLRSAWERSPAAQRTPLIDWSKILDPAAAARNLSELWQDPFRRAFDPTRSRATPEPDEPSQSKKAPAKSRSRGASDNSGREEIAELRRRLEELEARLED